MLYDYEFHNRGADTGRAVMDTGTTFGIRKAGGAAAPIVAALLVDDGAPVNPMFWHDGAHEHLFAIPNQFTADFAALCERYDVRGKFSVLPMPCALGGIDDKLSHVSRHDLAGFLRIIRNNIAPRFDITPELLTHLNAYRLTGGFQHVYEDEWVARATIAELTDYLALALEMLAYVELPATGVTSPWSTGSHNEQEYAQAIGAAQWRVHRRALTWYFLHLFEHGPGKFPWISRRDGETGQVVVSIPANTGDAFWDTQRPMSRSRRAARTAAMHGVDALLGPDGRNGRLRELVDQGCPVLLLTHWQSLFSDGTCAGLWGLEQLLKRLQKIFGDRLAWHRCIDVAEMTVRTACAAGSRG